MTVGRISVVRGEKPLYTLDNVVYLRRGSSDVQAQPDEIVSLVSQFAYGALPRDPKNSSPP